MTQQRTTTTTGAGAGAPLGDRVRAGLSVAVGMVLLIFLLQNLQDVKINFLWWDWRTDMVWALLVSALFGAVATFLLTALLRRQKPATGVERR